MKKCIFKRPIPAREGAFTIAGPRITKILAVQVPIVKPGSYLMWYEVELESEPEINDFHVFVTGQEPVGQYLGTIQAFNAGWRVGHVYWQGRRRVRNATSNDLLPCPFCAAGVAEFTASPEIVQRKEQVFVVCPCCSAQGGWARTEVGAARMWNMRANQEGNR